MGRPSTKLIVPHRSVFTYRFCLLRVSCFTSSPYSCFLTWISQLFFGNKLSWVVLVELPMTLIYTFLDPGCRGASNSRAAFSSLV